YVFGDGLAWYEDNWILLSMTVMSGLLVWRHYENINRLLKGTESRLGQKKG
ncbi:MAG: glycerol-3-phosphate acyltransferase, partial [Rhodoferax sp.]|nr:glycerol-3-phosphate acyltransferase [Rhodoferax sp.]